MTNQIDSRYMYTGNVTNQIDSRYMYTGKVTNQIESRYMYTPEKLWGVTYEMVKGI